MSLRLRDSAKLTSPRRTGDGYLVAEARVARTGIQIYNGDEIGRPDLKEVRVYRPPEEVFKKASLQSYAHRPLTNDHPREPVNDKNWKKFAVGHTADEIVRDGNFVRVPLTMMDGAAIKAWEDGKKELSLGYLCDLKWEPGEYTDDAGETHAYDAKQVNIRANHLALVTRARGGDQLRIGDAESYGEGMCPACGAELDSEGDCPSCGYSKEDMTDSLDFVDVEDTIDEFLADVDAFLDYNEKHYGKGSKGGQFAPSSGGGSSGGDGNDEEDDSDEDDDKPDTSKVKELRQELSTVREKIRETDDPEEKKQLAEEADTIAEKIGNASMGTNMPIGHKDPEDKQYGRTVGGRNDEGDDGESDKSTPSHQRQSQRAARGQRQRPHRGGGGGGKFGGGKGGKPEQRKQYTSSNDPTGAFGKLTQIQKELIRRRRAQHDAAPAWNEALHPRVPAGSPTGGQFASSGEAQAYIAAQLRRWKGARVEEVEEVRKDVPTGLFAFLKRKNKRKHIRYIIKTDSAGAITADENGSDGYYQGESIMKFVVDGVTVELPDQAGQIVQRALATRDNNLAEYLAEKKKRDDDAEKMKTDAATVATQLANQKAEIETLKKQVADSTLTPAQLDARVKERHEVITRAKSLIGDKLVIEGKTEGDMRRQVVDTFLGDTAKGWDDSQVSTSFATIIARPGKDPNVRNLADAMAPNGSGGSNVAVEDSYKRYIADLEKASTKSAAA